MRNGISLLAFCLFLLGCSDGRLSTSDVENLPTGDATGTSYTGSYAMAGNVTSCSGACIFIALGESVDLCAFEEIDPAIWQVTQDDGALTMIEDGETSPATGGVDADGTFVVGMNDPSPGEQVLQLISGQFTTDGFSATSKGQVNTDDLDCSLEFVLTAQRI